MRAGKIAAAAVLGMGMMLLGGCDMLNQQQKWEPQEDTAVSISEDGVIIEYVNDTLDESYYSASELETMITSDVADYNAVHGENTIQVKSYEAADGGKVSLVMEYATADDYATFNNIEFYSGSMINAQLAGYLFDGSFKKVKNGIVQGSSVSGSEVIKSMSAEVLVVTAPLEVHVPGTVLYTTTNAEVLASDDVNATGKTAEETADAGLELPSKQVYMGEEKSFDEKAAASRVYIIWE